MKHCEEYSELISAFIDNEISDAETETLKAHLATCRDCRAYLIYLEKIHTESAALAEEVPDGFSARVMNSIAASEKAQKRFSIARFKFTAIAAAIILLVFAAGRLESVFPSVVEESSSETSQPASENDSSAKAKELVPATLTPMYTQGEAASEPESSSEEKVLSSSEPAKAPSNENKNNTPVEIKNEPVADSAQMPKVESKPSDTPAVENESSPAPSIPAEDKGDADSDTSLVEETLPPEQNTVTDDNDAASADDSAASGAGAATVENALPPDADVVDGNGANQETTQETVTESDDSSEILTDEDETPPSIPPMPPIPQSEAYSCYISVKGEAALSLFSGYSSNIFEGNYLISEDKSNLANTLSLLSNSGFSYYRYDGDNVSSNFLLIIIP